MIKPKNIDKTLYCNDDFEIKIPFLPEFYTAEDKQKFDSFCELSKREFNESWTYDDWRKVYISLKNTLIEHDSTLVIDLYKMLPNAELAENLRLNILDSGKSVINACMAIIYARIAEIIDYLPDVHFGAEKDLNALDVAEQHSKRLFYSRGMAGNALLIQHGLPFYKETHDLFIKWLQYFDFKNEKIQQEYPFLQKYPEYAHCVSKRILILNNVEYSFDFVKYFDIDLEQHLQKIVEENKVNKAYAILKIKGTQIPFSHELQKIVANQGKNEMIFDCARMEGADIQLFADAIYYVGRMEDHIAFLKEFNGEFDRAKILSMVASNGIPNGKGTFMQRRFAKKLEKELDQDLITKQKEQTR